MPGIVEMLVICHTLDTRQAAAGGAEYILVSGTNTQEQAGAELCQAQFSIYYSVIRQTD